MTLCGRVVACPSAEMESEEVFEARMAVSGVRRSSSAKICRLRSSFSGTASMTRSASRKPSNVVTPALVDLPDDLEALVHAALVHVLEEDRHAAEANRLGNLRPHGARADHCSLINIHSFSP